MKKNVLIILLVILSFNVSAQTLHTWVGGNGSWADTASWIPSVVPPSSNMSIINFNDAGNCIVTDVPTQTIRQLLITGNSNITLQSSGATTLSINGATQTENLFVEQGSSLTIADSNNLTLTIITTASQYGNISGILNIKGGTFRTNALSTTRVTVHETGIVNHTGGVITASAATCIFFSGGVYNYIADSVSLTVPTATWSQGSLTKISGVTSGIPMGLSQIFHNFVWDCPQQTEDIILTSFPSGITGSFEVKNTNNFLLTKNVTGTQTWAGSLMITGGKFALRGTATAATTLIVQNLVFNNTTNPNAQIQLNSNHNNATGTVTLTVQNDMNIILGQNSSHEIIIYYKGGNGTEVVNLHGNFTQTGLFQGQIGTANAGGTQSFVFTGTTESVYSAQKNTIFGSLSNMQITGTTLQISNNSIQFTGNFSLTNSSAHLVFGANGNIKNIGNFSTVLGSSLTIASPYGITSNDSIGNVLSSGTRTFHTGTHFIYSGTNGQLTGDGLPIGSTGTITINLQQDNDLLTFTNTTLSGSGVNLTLIKGKPANVISFTNSTSSILTYAGTTPQITTNNEFAESNGPRRLVINNSSGVTLHGTRMLPANGILTLTNGLLHTTPDAILTIQNTSTTAIVGGSVSSYVRGPLERVLPSTSSANTYSFPIGKTNYANTDVILTGVATGGILTIRAEHFESLPSGGTIGTGLTELQSGYWKIEKVSGVGNLNQYVVSLTKSELAQHHRVAYSNILEGSYDNIGGTNIETSITSVIPITLFDSFAYFSIGTSVLIPGGTHSNYMNLTQISNVLSTQIVGGNIIFELPQNYDSSTEVFPVKFYEFSTGGNPYSVVIRPAPNSTILTKGDPGTGNSLIELMGVNRLTLDGRSGGVGNAINWIIRNTRTAATVGPTIRFLNVSTENTLTYLQVEGQNVSTSSGTLVFGTSAFGSMGSSNNTVSYCRIRNRSDITSPYPANAIYAAGSSGRINTYNSILNNQIFNFHLSGTSAHAGIHISSYNSAYNITGNSIFQENTISTASNQFGILISATTGNGGTFEIKNNSIGGSSANANGLWKVESEGLDYRFVGISMSASSTLSSNIEGNVIKSFDITSGTAFKTLSSGFTGIYGTSGEYTIKNNTIENIQIAFTSQESGIKLHGIVHDGNSMIQIQNNTIGGIQLKGGIVKSLIAIKSSTSSSTQQIHITGNTIGSLSALIENNSGSLGGFSTMEMLTYGIHVSGTRPANISNNSIFGLAYSGNAGPANNPYTIFQVAGIYRANANSANNVIENNLITNLSSSSTNTIGEADQSGVIGLFFASSGNGHSIKNNSIHTISGIDNNFWYKHVIGLYYQSGSSVATNHISQNFIHTITHSGNTPEYNKDAQMIGLFVNNGSATISNNMIRMGINANGSDVNVGYKIDGIREIGGASKFYYNSVFIGGDAAASDNATYAFTSYSTTANRRIANNIFFNARSNSIGKNYAIKIASNADLISNHNCLYVSGTNGVLGFFNTDILSLTHWKNISGLDQNSISADPLFKMPNGNVSDVSLHIQSTPVSPVKGAGMYIPEVLIDFDGELRSTSHPDIGADEINGVITGNNPFFSNANISIIFDDNVLYIKSDENATRMSVAIYNSTGVLIHRTESDVIDIREFPQGLYIVYVRNEGSQLIRKIVKM